MFNAAVKIEDLEQENEELRLKNYNDIEMPTKTIEELNKKTSMLDKYTIEWILKYLILDSYEFVKNNAKTINKESWYEAIIYRDWALSRNEWLIQALKKSANINEKTYKDRITWEIKNKKK